jgi:hypothetical protein
MVGRIASKAASRPAQHLVGHECQTVTCVERRGYPVRRRQRGSATAHLAAVGNVVVDEKSVMHQLDCYGDAEKVVRVCSKSTAGGQAQRRP